MSRRSCSTCFYHHRQTCYNEMSKALPQYLDTNVCENWRAIDDLEGNDPIKIQKAIARHLSRIADCLEAFQTKRNET